MALWVAVLLMTLSARAQEAYAPAGEAAAQTPPGDPPSQVARLSVAIGNVSVEAASVDQFSAAEVNYTLTTGDRLYTDAGANAELETGELAVRLGQQADLTVTAMTDQLEQFGLAQGNVHLRSYTLNPSTAVELDTPNVALTVVQPGDLRVDVDPNGDATTVWVISGQIQVDGNGLQQMLETGQRVKLSNGNPNDPVAAQWLDAVDPDGLDGFSADRDGLYESSMASEAQIVDPGTIGAGDLSANGDWETDEDEGPVWYPSGLAVGWTPYSCGRWAWVAPWGWTWIGCETWGFAPFHYGRWEHRGSRWGWIPGPRAVRPVYSPAMVVFVGGAGLATGEARLTAWFPLGPHETYVPWYHASPMYLNRVNVSNIFSRDAIEVRSIYNQRTEASVYVDAGMRGYVNRPAATVAISQASFAAGRSVGQSMAQVSREQMAGAPVLPHPLVTPQRSAIVFAPARAVPARQARPALASRTEQDQVTAAQAPAPTPASSEPIYENGAAPAAKQPGGVVRRQTPVTGAQSARPVPTQRPLFHEAVPPEPKPSFDEQQKAIETNDPGRPLEPQQMDNLRQNKPAGPPQERETQHPPPASRAVPVQRTAPPPRPRR